ncbi:MAG: hypothetical protein JRN62_06085 [Nitrososphaerota archaeon]|nr:hypothetical protein [Nitrososphaerota archaeon]
MARYVLAGPDGVVVNVVEWDGTSDWSPPDNLTIVQSDSANIGDVLS